MLAACGPMVVAANRSPDDLASPRHETGAVLIAVDTYIVARRVGRGDRAATAWAWRVVAGVDARRYAVVLVAPRRAAIAPLMPMLRRRYHPLYSDALPPALHVTVWVPAHDWLVR